MKIKEQRRNNKDNIVLADGLIESSDSIFDYTVSSSDPNQLSALISKKGETGEPMIVGTMYCDKHFDANCELKLEREINVYREEWREELEEAFLKLTQLYYRG
jgi:hypothetical protein